MAAPPTRPIDVVNHLLKAIEVLDYDTGLQVIAPDCEYSNMPMATVRGPEGVRAVLEPFFAPTLANEFRILRQTVDGDTVFLERLDRHQIGPERWVELPVAGAFVIRDGLITVWRDYFDLATLFGQWPELQPPAA